MHLRIGTRGSQLALWQAHYVAERLQAGGATVEIVLIETKGDQILDQALAKIGSKGLFTAELEAQLLSQDIDLAVHSAKDMPSVLPEGLEIIAFGPRENPQDVLVSLAPGLTLAELDEKAVIGTSSTRRTAILRHYYPKVQIRDVRGNLQTRLRKLEEGHYTALLLAFAGVHRMGYTHHIAEHLPLEIFTPAVGQGSIALEAAVALPNEKKQFIRQQVNHEATEICLRAERTFLKTLQGGCSVPVFGLAQWENDAIALHGGIISLDGQTIIQERQQGHPAEAAQLGHQLAQTLLSRGGAHLLKAIKNELSS